MACSRRERESPSDPAEIVRVLRIGAATSHHQGRIRGGLLMAESGRTLSTAVHVLRALEFTAEHPKGVSVKALARALDVSLSSAYSLSNSLRYEGFLELAPTGSGLYVLGPKMVTLYRSYVESTLQPERLEAVPSGRG